jgi:hypothetical protein
MTAFSCIDPSWSWNQRRSRPTEAGAHCCDSLDSCATGDQLFRRLDGLQVVDTLDTCHDRPSRIIAASLPGTTWYRQIPRAMGRALEMNEMSCELNVAAR